jgi:hypothetical protein
MHLRKGLGGEKRPPCRFAEYRYERAFRASAA